MAEFLDGIKQETGGASSGGLYESIAIIADHKASSTGGGTFTTGAWRTRDLNTEVTDADAIVSISTNQFTLQSGTYDIFVSAPAYGCLRHQCRLYDITGTASVQDGSSEFSAINNTQSRSTVAARVTIGSANAYTVEHSCEATKSSVGFGVDGTFGGSEVYTIVEIRKVQ